MARREHDLSTGPIAGHFRTLAVPAAIGMLFTTLYNVVDVFFAGALSTEAQAGLAVGFQAFFITVGVGIGLGVAMSALVGNAKGSKDSAHARRLAAQGLTFGVVATLVLMVLCYLFGHRLIGLISEPGGYRDAANTYLLFLILALPGFLLAFAGNGILQAHGDSVTLQRAQMAAFFANVGLNPLLIYGVPGIWGGLGFNGIALATALSQTGVMIWVLAHVFRLDILQRATRHDFRLELTTAREIIAQMLPTTSAFVVLILSGFVVQYALKGFGGEALAGYIIALRIEQILLLPVLGMTGALVPIAAQNFGAGEFDRVRNALFFCWKAGFVMTLIAAPILWFGGGLLMGVFTNDPEVIRVGSSYLRVDSLLMPIYMMLFASNSFLQAVKRPVWTLWISLYRQGFGVAFFVWLFLEFGLFDIWGVWFGIGIAVLSGWVIAMVVTFHVARQEIGGLRRPPIPEVDPA